jgi:hypothetical protein
MASAAAVTGAVSAGSRVPASARAASRPAARAASQALVAGLPVKSSRISRVAAARSQCRSPGRRARWAASIRDSSSSRAALAQAAAVPGGGDHLEWAACAASWVSTPHSAG